MATQKRFVEKLRTRVGHVNRSERGVRQGPLTMIYMPAVVLAARPQRLVAWDGRDPQDWQGTNV